MKKKILQIVVACIFMQVLICGKVMSQTAVHITYATDCTWTYCPVPIMVNIIFEGTATGYLATDSVTLNIFFGDGGDTTIRSHIDSTYHYFWTNFNHLYNAAGQYTLKYVATGPDGMADSITNTNQFALGDTCGNISGRMYLDNNGNCIFDAGDSILRGFPVILYQNSIPIAWSYSDINGDYWFNPPTGYTYTVVPQDMSTYGFSVNCPTSGNYVINLTSTSYGNDFGLSCLNGFDMAGYIWGWHFRPGFDSYMDLSAYNLRCQPTTGTVKLILDPLVTYSSSWWGPAPTQSGDTLIWNYSNYTNNYYYYYWWNWWGNNEFWDYLTLHTSSSAQLGDSVCFTLIIDPITGDADPSNNTIHYCHVISNACDPNFKEVFPKGIGATGDISPTQRLTYALHFQNVGNDTAYNVSVYDTLSQNLDLNTFQPLNADHTFRTEMLPNNVVKFTFDNIMLPDSLTNPTTSQGQVTYSIKPKAGLADLTYIYNTAGIVFDFNNPVITNTVHNRIKTALSVPEIANNSSLVSIFPNPAVNELNIVFNNQKASDVQLVDALGNVVVSYKQVKGNLVVNTAKIPSGIYTLVVNNIDATQREKVIILH